MDDSRAAGVDRGPRDRPKDRRGGSTLANDQTIQFPHHEYGIFFNVPRIIAFIVTGRPGRGRPSSVMPAPDRDHEPSRPGKVRDDALHPLPGENQWYLPPHRATGPLHPEDDYPTMNFTAYHHEVFADAARTRFPDSTITTDGR